MLTERTFTQEKQPEGIFCFCFLDLQEGPPRKLPPDVSSRASTQRICQFQASQRVAWHNESEVSPWKFTLATPPLDTLWTQVQDAQS